MFVAQQRTEKGVGKIGKSYIASIDLTGPLMQNQEALESLDKIAQKEITSFLGIRNSAAHGHYSDYDQQQVTQMLNGVTSFISKTT
jgi:hypothetical protein